MRATGFQTVTPTLTSEREEGRFWLRHVVNQRMSSLVRDRDAGYCSRARAEVDLPVSPSRKDIREQQTVQNSLRKRPVKGSSAAAVHWEVAVLSAEEPAAILPVL